MILLMLCSALATWAVGGDGLYFLQDFEDQSTFPETKPETETAFNVDGQGEWLYMGSYQSTNSSYTYGGTGMNLRLPKNGVCHHSCSDQWCQQGDILHRPCFSKGIYLC